MPVSIESGMLVTYRMQYAMSVSLGGKYVFATVMPLVLPMCILISCSYVLCVLMALGMFMFVTTIGIGNGVMLVYLIYLPVLTPLDWS